MSIPTTTAFLFAVLFQGTAEVKIVTEPEGVEVWQGDMKLGTTTAEGLRLLSVEPGNVTYSLRKAGYGTVKRTVRVTAEKDPIVVFARLHFLSSTPSAPEADASKPKKGSSTGKLVAIGLGAAAAGGAAVALASKKDPLEVDDDGDGFSEKAGDCNDLNRDVNPRGEFSVMVTSFFTGTVNCNVPYDRISVRATNLSCTNVNVSSVTLTEVQIGDVCLFDSFTDTIPLRNPTVMPGARDQEVASLQYRGTAGCCSDGDCGRGDDICAFRATYTIETSAGQSVVASDYSVLFPAGRSCPACSSAAAKGPRLKSLRPDRQ